MHGVIITVIIHKQLRKKLDFFVALRTFNNSNELHSSQKVIIILVSVIIDNICGIVLNRLVSAILKRAEIRAL